MNSGGSTINVFLTPTSRRDRETIVVSEKSWHFPKNLLQLVKQPDCTITVLLRAPRVEMTCNLTLTYTVIFGNKSRFSFFVPLEESTKVHQHISETVMIYFSFV